MGKDVLICPDCQKRLPWLKAVCQRCALPLDSPRGCCCSQILPPYDVLQALFDYAWPIKGVIAKWKYGSQFHWVKMFASMMVERLTPIYPPECIVPMPLHPKRLRQRGFNQSIELASLVAKAKNIPLDRRSCTRVINTPSQSQLGARARSENIAQATFSVLPSFSAKHVLIIEDIVTTGATIAALSACLKRQGVQTVEIWCCCRTLKNAKSL